MRVEKRILNDAMRVLGKVVKFVLFFYKTMCFLEEKSRRMEIEGKLRHPYDPYVVWVWKKRDWQNSVKFRNFRLIVQIEA